MKKFVSIVLALTMVLALGISAFAFDSDTDGRSQDTTVTLDLGSACATWSIPSELAFASTEVPTAEGTVAITEWKAAVGSHWTITCSADSVNLKAGEIDSGYKAGIAFDGVEAAYNSASASAPVTATLITESGNTRLAGTVSGNISFTLAYGDVA